MRPALASLALALLSAGVCACGGSHTGAGSASKTAAGATNVASTTARRRDRDNDEDNNSDDNHVLYYGHAADPQDERALATLIRRYYAAAAAENGAATCSMLAPFLAESTPEDLGHSAGLHGGSCAVVMSKLLKKRHRELVARNATLKFLELRVQGNDALAILSFSTLPEIRKLRERRIGGRWWLIEWFDGIVE